MTAPTDAERAREIVWTMRSGHQCADIRCGACAEFIASALADVRADERERAARIAETQYRRDPDGIDSGWMPIGVRYRVEKRIADAIRRQDG